MSELESNPHLFVIREWTEDDGTDPDEWPAPPEYTEYRMGGQMRLDVLKRIGRDADDDCTVRLIEGSIEGGYSEYTVEHDYTIEVWVDEGDQSQRVFDCEHWSMDSSLAAFLRWLTAEVTP